MICNKIVSNKSRWRFDFWSHDFKNKNSYTDDQRRCASQKTNSKIFYIKNQRWHFFIVAFVLDRLPIISIHAIGADSSFDQFLQSRVKFFEKRVARQIGKTTYSSMTKVSTISTEDFPFRYLCCSILSTSCWVITLTFLLLGSATIPITSRMLWFV